MRLSEQRLKQIKELYKLDASQPEAAMLSTALRRACFAKPASISWQEHIAIVSEITSRLYEIDAAELSKINSQGTNALQLAIDCLLKYSVNERNPEIIFYHLCIIKAVAALYPIDELVKIEHFLRTKGNSLYAGANTTLGEEFIIQGAHSIPQVDLSIYAIKLLLATIKNNKLAFAKLQSIAESKTAAELSALPKPIVFLTMHSDHGVQDFFKQNSKQLVQNSYKLLAIELPSDGTPAEYLALNTNINVRGRTNFAVPEDYLHRINILKNTIRAMQANSGIVEFIDPVPKLAVNEQNVHMYVIKLYSMINLLMSFRNQGLVYAAHANSIRHETGAVLLVGAEHYAGLKDYFAKLVHVNPQFFILTGNIQRFLERARADSTAKNDIAGKITGMLAEGVGLIDVSSKDYFTKLQPALVTTRPRGPGNKLTLRG